MEKEIRREKKIGLCTGKTWKLIKKEKEKILHRKKKTTQHRCCTEEASALKGTLPKRRENKVSWIVLESAQRLWLQIKRREQGHKSIAYMTWNGKLLFFFFLKEVEFYNKQKKETNFFFLFHYRDPSFFFFYFLLVHIVRPVQWSLLSAFFRAGSIWPGTIERLNFFLFLFIISFHFKK